MVTSRSLAAAASCHAMRSPQTRGRSVLVSAVNVSGASLFAPPQSFISLPHFCPQPPRSSCPPHLLPLTSASSASPAPALSIPWSRWVQPCSREATPSPSSACWTANRTSKQPVWPSSPSAHHSSHWAHCVVSIKQAANKSEQEALTISRQETASRIELQQLPDSLRSHHIDLPLVDSVNWTAMAASQRLHWGMQPIAQLAHFWSQRSRISHLPAALDFPRRHWPATSITPDLSFAPLSSVRSPRSLGAG